MEEEVDKKYDIVCPYCGKKQCCTKSIGHIVGVNTAGCGSCLSCGGFMNICYDEDKDEMTARTWDEYLAEFEYLTEFEAEDKEHKEEDADDSF